MPTIYKAVPLTDLASPKDAVAIEAETNLAALLRAKTVLGDRVPFDLMQDGKLVVSYRPTRGFKPIQLRAEGEG